MKRTRDDVFPGSQFKRPFASSRVESYVQSQVTVNGSGGGGGTSQKLTTNDALTYLKEVKDMFQDQREKYDTFLEVMKDFKAQRTDTAGVIQRVKELFKGHNNLILGFNTFLPKGYEITLDDDEAPTKKTVEFEEAISFVNKIKKRFQNDEHVYKLFLDILNMYRKEHKDINEVYSEVATLFDDHPDLLEEFTRFLPNNSESPVMQNFPYGRGPAPRHGERSSALPSSRQVHTDKQRRRDKVPNLQVERDLSVDRPDMDEEKAMLKVQKDQRKQKDNRDRKNREHNDRESEHDNKDFNVHHLSDKRKSSKRVDGFGMSSSFTFNDDKDALKGMYNEGFVFCEKVKERLSSSDDYQAFLKCLNIYSNGIIKRNDLQNLVTDLLGKHPDLMDEFNDFLERCENIDGYLAGVMSKKSLIYDGPVHKPIKVDEKDKERKREMEAEKERSKEKYWAKSIQELDLSDCQRCTPSYRLLPDDYPIPAASQKSKLGAQVLNDHWVSVTSGSEDYSFKHMRRNQYEESLFRCEDDRFELDMLIESMSSTAKRAEELLNSANNSKSSLETPFHVENHFTALHVRCIERIYGDHGLDVIDILRKNPTIALPVILTRLKQKQEEWTSCRSDFNKVWADVYAKNHYKSLDHRSFYFKQQDSKNLSTKNLVAEIKELNEKQRKEDDRLLAISAGNRQPIVPQLDYDYTDERVHEDLYKLFQYSCEEICSTKEQLSKVMRLWTTFLEPMLGVPTRTQAKDSNVAIIDLKEQQPEKQIGGNFSQGLPNFSQSGLMIGDASGKEHDVGESERGCGDDSSSTTQKELKGVVGAENQFAFSEAATVGFGVTASESSICPTDGLDRKADADAVPLLASTLAKLSWSGMLKDNHKVDRGNEDSAGPHKSEKEEGELSPNGEFEENSVGFKEDGGKALSKGGNHIYEHENHSVNGEGVGGVGNGAEADDEDSGNVSERGGDVSGNESAGDECSHEEHEEEDAEHNEADPKAESEGEAEGMADAHYVGGDGTTLPFSERFLCLSKPLAKLVQAVIHEERKDSRIFYGNDDFYALFRLHQALYDRILSAKTNCINAEKQKNSDVSDSPDPYSRFMDALYNLLDGSIDNAKFEDQCRAIIGNQSYVLFTLDKLIYKLVKQLQVIASDEMDSKILQLYEYERSRKHVKFNDSVYYENARVFLFDENIYRMKFALAPHGLSIQLMDSICEKPEAFAVSVEPNFAAYLHSDFLLAFSSRKEQRDVYLHRNNGKYIGMDEGTTTCMALEGVRQFNGLECKISCTSSKISYVLDTEDFFFRPRSKRIKTSRTNHSSRSLNRAHRFHRFLSDAIAS